jgi:preprotein translocase subunit Sec61beta
MGTLPVDMTHKANPPEEITYRQRRSRIGLLATKIGLAALGLIAGFLIWPVGASVQQIDKQSILPPVVVMVAWLLGCIVLLRSQKYRAVGIGLAVGLLVTIAAIWFAGPCLVTC